MFHIRSTQTKKKSNQIMIVVEGTSSSVPPVFDQGIEGDHKMP